MSDPFFVKLHLQRSTRNPHLTLASRNTRPTEYSSVVPISLSRFLETPSKSITLTKDPYYHLKDKDCRLVIGSCNGLLCLFGYSYNYRESWLRFWNPATRTISDKLGHCHNPVIPYRLTFGYDNSMDTYKVVALEPEARVFSFRDNVWKSIQRFPLYYRLNWVCIWVVMLIGWQLASTTVKIARIFLLNNMWLFHLIWVKRHRKSFFSLKVLMKWHVLSHLFVFWWIASAFPMLPRKPN